MNHLFKGRPTLLALSLSIAAGMATDVQALEIVSGIDVIELQSFTSQISSEPRDVNDLGFTVGFSTDREGYDRAVLWDEAGNLIRLDPSDFNSIDSVAHALNSRNVAAGSLFSRATVWVDQQFQELESGNGGVAFDINEADIAAGFAYGLDAGPRAVLWQDLQVRRLGGEPAGTDSRAYAINSYGSVAGEFYDSADSASVNMPVLWQGDRVSELGLLPGYEAKAYPAAINDFDQVAGVSVDGNGMSRAVLWQNGFIADLGTLGGDFAQAEDVNNGGAVVGSAAVADGTEHPFLWRDGVMYDLAPAIGFDCEPGLTCKAVATGLSNIGHVVVWVSKTGDLYGLGYNTTLTYGYRLTLTEAGIAQLPSVPALLEFVAPVGSTDAEPIPPAPTEADLHLQIEAPGVAVRGSNARYQFIVGNAGPGEARAAVLSVNLPGNVRLESVLGADCSGTSTVTCDLGDVYAGNGVIVQFDLTPTGGRRLTLSASLQSDSPDPDNSNNTDTVTLRVY